MRRRFLLGVGAASAALLTARRALAQSSAAFPNKPVRFIVGLGPGSGADTGTRFIAERIGKLTGQPTIVENRPGGDGVIAVQNLLGAPADGHTLLYLSPSPMVLTPLLNPATPYDPLRDIRPVAYLARGQAVIVTGTKSRFTKLSDLLAEAKAKPEAVKMSNYGHHYRVGALQLQQVSGARFTHVPYKGAAQANNDVAAGDIDVAITDLGGAIPMIESGHLRPLAQTGPTRNPLLPNLPTARELGISYELIVWTGFGISAKTPDDAARKLEQLLIGVIASPEFKEYNDKQGAAEIIAGSGEQLTRLITDETTRYRELAKSFSLN